MAKITRVYQQLFGSTAGTAQLGKFGSLAAGSPVTYSGTTADPVAMQSLSQFLAGWDNAVIGANSPAIEDMNTLFYLVFRQLAYIFQAGVAEWDATTTYFIGSVVNSGGVFYVSLTDNNAGNALSNTTNWKIQGMRQKTVTATYTVLATDDYVRMDTTTAAFTSSLPAVSAGFVGQRFTIKNIGYNLATIAANGADLMDGNPTIGLTQYQSQVFYNNGASWDLL